MEETKKPFVSTVMEGKYCTISSQKPMTCVPFNDNTRKFFERSYYGNLYNSDMELILDIFENVVEDTESNAFQISDKADIPRNKKPAFILLNSIESLYLIERQKLKVFTDDGTEMSFNDLIEITMKSDQRIWQKYIVYRDIRQRGYIIRAGYGGRADFRVFARGAKFAKDSAKYVYFIIQDGIPVALNELDGVVNQVLGDRKNLILAIFDKLGDSTFYNLQRFKFKKVTEFDKMWNRETIVTPNN